MNILLLTPDSVGSTFLQRMLTIYMQFNNFDKPIINLHELTNGVQSYYSDIFNREVMGKKWNTFQTLQTITELLAKTDHYKTARVAHYHIKRRGDSIQDQIQFYRYLNDNFFIISCRRTNVFEHALSWALVKINKSNNVYTPYQKINSFIDFYKDPVTIERPTFIQILEDYKDYLHWSDNMFDVASYYDYDEHVQNIEKYILNLPIFTSQTNKLTWNEVYGQEFNDFNRCHYIQSDIGTLALGNDDNFSKLSLTYETLKNNEQPVVDQTKNGTINQDLVTNVLARLPDDRKEFVNTHIEAYIQASQSIDRMVSMGILVGGLPIKKQTLAEKRRAIKNFNECLDVYNQWIVDYPKIGKPLDLDQLSTTAVTEREFWKPQLTLGTTQQTAKLPLASQQGIPKPGQWN